MPKIDSKFHYTKLDPNDELVMLIVGSRTFTDYDVLNGVCQILGNNNKLHVVSGGATGADSLAEVFAKNTNSKFTKIPADWNKYGKRAGYIRNREMHKFISQYEHRLCIAFWDGISKGTAHNFDLANEFDTPIFIYNFKTQEINIYNN